MMFILKKSVMCFLYLVIYLLQTCDVFQYLVMYTRKCCHVYSISCDVCSIIVFWVI